MRGSNIVRAILHLAGASKFADAAKELQDGRVGQDGDFARVPAEMAEQILHTACHEFIHAAEGDLNAAEQALESVLVAAPKRETLGRALRDAEALRTYLLNQSGREQRAGLLSEDAQKYFDLLLDLTCRFIARTVQDIDLSGRAERAGISELLTGVDWLREVTGNLLDEVRASHQSAGSQPRRDLLAVIREAGELARQSALPEILPDMDRLVGLQRTVGPLAEVSQPLVIVGEGGLGKSVLAGQLFGHLNAALGREAVVLFVPCTRIPPSASLDSADAVDLAFGQAAADDRDTGSLSEILAMVPDDSRIVVVLDTLDLVLTDDDVDDIAYVLRRISRRATLFLTCRDQEWHSYFDLQIDLIAKLYRVPRLTPDDILFWARRYVETKALPAQRREAFVESLSQRVAGAAVGEIFSSPLRLAMACEIYATAGAIPADLTVTRLYDAYWDRRVARDRRGRRSRRAKDQVRAAEALAASVWEASTSRFVEFVSESQPLTAAALNDLLSEGTIKVVGGRYAFFHQTYAEFAVARQLAIYGAEVDLARLEAGLRAGLPGYWAIAKHLLLLDANAQRLEELSGYVPRESVEGVRIHLQSAFTHDDRLLVEQIVQEVREHRPDVLVAASSVLESAPASCAGAALEAALWCLQHADRSKFAKVAVTTATLIRTLDPPAQTSALERALDVVLAKTDVHGLTDTVSVTRRLLEQTVAASADGVDRWMLIRRYGELPEPARAEVVAVFQREGLNLPLTAGLIVEALNWPCPSGAVDDLVALLCQVWQHPDVRSAAGWSDWKSMLEADLPDRWDACQVRLLRHLSTNPGTAGEVLEAAFSSATVVARDRYTNAVMFLANDDPYLVARAVVAAAADDATTGVVGTFASVAIHVATALDERARTELGEALRKYLVGNPRKVWPAVIKLGSDDIDRLRGYLQELTRFAVEDASGMMHGQVAVRKAFDAILTSASPDVVRELEPDLKLLCASSEPADRERAARLQGRMTPISPEAREWVSEQLLAGNRQKVAKAAARTVADSLDDWTRPAWTAVGLPWLLSLLKSRHASAVRELVTAIDERSEELTFSPEWAAAVVDRLIASLTASEDSQVQTALIRLVVAIDRSVGISAARTGQIVEAYLGAMRSGLRPSAGRPDLSLPATFARLTEVITAVGLRHFSVEECGDLLVRVLTELDSAAVANTDQRSQEEVAGRARRNLGTMLVGVVRKHPVLLPRLEEAWERSSASNKAAVAECVSVIEAGTQGIVSLRLARRGDCPPEVASYLHERFGG